MKKLFLMLFVSSLFSEVAYADYMCGSSPCYSEGSCDQETGYCNDCSDEGYGHNAEGKCVRCQDPNCYDDGDVCEDDYTYCDECKDGYESINGKCEEIIDSSNCSENCDTCVSGGKCAYCQGGYYVENGVCKQNPENCSWYNVNEGKCGGCNSGYGIIGGSCAACPENCNNCNENGCTGCINGYYAENGVCKKNPEGCSYYNASTGKCTSCGVGFYLAENGSCKAYPEGCSRYNIAKRYCIECSSPMYTLRQNGTCVKTETKITGCMVDDEFGEYCVHCDEGYMLLKGKCIVGNTCPDGYYAYTSPFENSKSNRNNCAPNGCSSFGVGPFEIYCGQCRSSLGQGYAKNNDCVDDCGEGYLAIDGTCVPENCLNNSMACYRCIDGYYAIDGKCKSECPIGYVIGTNRYGYPSCFPADLGCGYGEKQVGDECVAREDGEGCGVGFYLKDNLCVSESKGCGDGYLGKDGVCISSANGCGAGYKDMGGYCNRIQYTPAEAAPLLHNDNTNSVTITFKK